MSDVIRRLPWWGWALLVLVGVLVVLLSVPGLRDHAAKMLGGAFASWMTATIAGIFL